MSKIPIEVDGVIRYKEVRTPEEIEYDEAVVYLNNARISDEYDEKILLRALLVVVLGPPTLRNVYGKSQNY